MVSTLKLPVGIENFEEIRKLGFYYIDKTRLIEQLLQGWGKVTLFTRPRHLGKTLNMSMLKSFFQMAQIKNKRYDEALRDEDRCDILAYGIAFAGSGAGWLVRSCKLFLLYIRGWYSRLFWRYFYEA